MPLSNPSLQPVLVTDDHYLGLPLNPKSGTFHQGRLESALNTLHGTFEDHDKVMLVAVQLSVIQPPPMTGDQFLNGPIARFLRHLKSMMLSAQQKLSAKQLFQQPANIDFIWMHYSNPENIPAYAVVLLINRDGYVGHSPWGKDQDTLTYRIQRAWLSALHAPAYLADKAVIFKPPSFQILGYSPENMATVFQIASYCCQATDLDYGLGSNTFGCSRPSNNAAYR